MVGLSVIFKTQDGPGCICGSSTWVYDFRKEGVAICSSCGHNHFRILPKGKTRPATLTEAEEIHFQFVGEPMFSDFSEAAMAIMKTFELASPPLLKPKDSLLEFRRALQRDTNCVIHRCDFIGHPENLRVLVFNTNPFSASSAHTQHLFPETWKLVRKLWAEEGRKEEFTQQPTDVVAD